MKRLSVRLRITLLYTFFMAALTGVSLLLLLSFSSREVLTSTGADLEEEVWESAEELTLQEGEVRVDSDFYSLEKGIYLALYDESGYFLYGRVPYGFDVKPEFEDGNLRKLKDRQKKWFVYDQFFKVDGKKPVYVRGVTSITDVEEKFYVTMRIALFSLPLMLVITVLAGFYFTGRTLLPVKQMTGAVRKIRKEQDLSGRIGLDGHGRKDEIYVLAETFDDMLAQTERLFQREKQFTSDVSHELRTPISVILAQCGSLLEDDTLADGQKQQICLIERKASGMANMISELLFLSRVDEGRQKIHKEMLNLSELTEMAVEEQKLLTEEQGIQRNFETQIEPEIYAQADESYYIRLLINLLENAVYYGRENGFVKVYLSETEKSVTGIVEDNGIGISEENLIHIWERFFRVDASRSTDSHSGLGLSMVKWIVEAHGGTIRAESRHGEGTRFVFEIPK